MRLSNRITRLERALSEHDCDCDCDDGLDLAWPGHNPGRNCPECGGQRFIYHLSHHPHHAEAALRNVLPILRKSYNGQDHADLTRLTDQELRQLKAALLAADRH